MRKLTAVIAALGFLGSTSLMPVMAAAVADIGSGIELSAAKKDAKKSAMKKSSKKTAKKADKKKAAKKTDKKPAKKKAAKKPSKKASKKADAVVLYRIAA